jgi:hypothetical protein
MHPRESIEPLESRIAPAFGRGVVDLSLLNGGKGFELKSGLDADDFGKSLSSAGDINGDGFDDLIIAAPGVLAGSGASHSSGSSYVLFGSPARFPAELNLATLNGANGFRIDGRPGEFSGTSVSGAGDVNGDGLDDLIVGAPGAVSYPERFPRADGAGYVIFGHRGSFAPVLNVESLNGINGFTIAPAIKEGSLGYSVSGAGDINGDGLADMMVAGTTNSYALLGNRAFPAVFNLSELNGTNGFSLGLNSRVAGGGDINGDGFDDLVFSAAFTYVVFGKATPFAPDVLPELDGTNGFRIAGGGGWAAVGNSGDVNGDGFDDIVIGERVANDAYMVFGKATSFPDTVELSTLDGSNGFRFDGPDILGGSGTGLSVSGAGDVNGDGFNDVLIGGESLPGASYLLYGKAGPFPPVLTSAAGSVLFTGNQVFGTGSVVSGGGDINGDGYSDLLIGAEQSAFAVFGGEGLGVLNASHRRATFLDVDGDIVKVKVDRGELQLSDFLVADDGRFTSLNLQRSSFVGATVTISAKRGPEGGNGLVDLGELDASGVDLGKVTIHGDLGRIDAGVGDPLGTAMRALVVQSFGRFASAADSSGEPLQSFLNGSVGGNGVTGGIKVKGSVSDSNIHVNGNLVRLSVGADFERSTLSVLGVVVRDAPGAAIGAITVGADIDHSRLLVGYNRAGNAVTGNVQVGSIVVGGDWIASDLAVGVKRGVDGFFATHDDLLVQYGNVFGATIDLKSLDGTNGFRIRGPDEPDQFGYTLRGAGDVNGDGIDDFIIGAPNAAAQDNGSAYVVFGRSEGIPPTVDVTTLDGTNGFRFDGRAYGDQLGTAVSGAGDVNGDGFDDIIVGNSFRASFSHSAYVIFGRASGFPAVVQWLDLDGNVGFELHGAPYVGPHLDAAGDFNGDGFDDVIVGDGGRSHYIVFGKSGGFSREIDVGQLGAAEALRIDETGGRVVAGAGDVNGDGLDDVLIGTGDDCFLVFGQRETSGTIHPGSLDGTNGFKVASSSGVGFFGFGVSGAGDINNDGFDDLIIGASLTDRQRAPDAGAAYVIFGRVTGFAPVLFIEDLNGNNGFRLDGVDSMDFAGSSVSGAGDINADGFDDVLVAAPYASPGGTTYLVYGRAEGFSPVLSLSQLNGRNGFQIAGAGPDSYSGVPVSGCGDINDDGFDDILIGGIFTNSGQGSAYLLYGRSDPTDHAAVDYEVPRGLARASNGITARIASIVINGHALGTFGGTDHFGIVAEEIGSLRVGEAIIRLVPGAGNDQLAIDLGQTFDLAVREVPRLSRFL